MNRYFSMEFTVEISGFLTFVASIIIRLVTIISYYSVLRNQFALTIYVHATSTYI